MDIAKKLEYAERSIQSISRHDDEDSLVRKAALRKLQEAIAEETRAIDERATQRMGEMGVLAK